VEGHTELKQLLTTEQVLNFCGNGREEWWK